ncbi:MAG TPA: type II toxin-antitoxin system HicA family toxin [Candidatus Paceibacterota bacterium]
MPKEPRVTAKEIVAVLEKCGFVFSRQSGSHMIYKNSYGKRVTIPYHRSKILHPKVLRSIMKDAEISLEQLLKLL